MPILSHKFVDLIPENVDEGILYVSLSYGTVIHRCCCGCGREVVTPLSPTDWKLIFDGETISLTPSIGNWNFPCRSHYWIRNNRAEWVEDWSDPTMDDENPRNGKGRDKSKKNKKESHKSSGLWPKFKHWICRK